MGNESLVSQNVIDEMCQMASQTNPEGVFVEFGVYKGGSAVDLVKISDAQGRELHLFDTFTGMPVSGEFDQHKIGDFGDTSYEYVKSRVPQAIFHVGIFPATMPSEFPKVSFLHIDADQYECYKDAVRIFRPLMLPNSIMWFDDPGCLASADKAIYEDFAPEEILTAQCGKKYVRFD